MTSKFYSHKEAAAMLGIYPSTLTLLVKKGEVSHTILGKRRYYTQHDIDNAGKKVTANAR